MTSENRLEQIARPLGLALLIAVAPARAAVPDGPVEGFGTDLPLAQAVEGIVPSGLQVVIAKGVDPSTSISWDGGPSWKEVLRSALVKAGLVSKIDDAEVVVDYAPPPAQIWDVYDGETVAQTIQRWSRQAGYTPVPIFAAQDRWRLFVSEHFSGSFEEALEWLSKGFSRQPSKPIFYLGANKTIDILSQATGTTPVDAGAGSF
jgi:hypothetical protein